jgi:hypothetical protein
MEGVGRPPIGVKHFSIADLLARVAEAEGGSDDQGPGCFCFLVRLQPRGARIIVGAAKERISGWLDQ